MRQETVLLLESKLEKNFKRLQGWRIKKVLTERATMPTIAPNSPLVSNSLKKERGSRLGSIADVKHALLNLEAMVSSHFEDVRSSVEVEVKSRGTVSSISGASWVTSTRVVEISQTQSQVTLKPSTQLSEIFATIAAETSETAKYGPLPSVTFHGLSRALHRFDSITDPMIGCVLTFESLVAAAYKIYLHGGGVNVSGRTTAS